MARKLASVSKLPLSLHHISHPQPYNEENEKVLWQHVKTSKSVPAPNKQRPTPPPRSHSICEMICIHPDAEEAVVFPRCLAHRLSRFWITCMILRAGEMQTPERCCGHLVPATCRKQSRAVRGIIQHPGTAATKHPAGPNRSAWVGIAGYQQGVGAASCTSPRNSGISPQHPKPDIWALYNSHPQARPGVCCISSFDCLAGIQFWGSLRFFQCGIWFVGCFLQLSQRNN